MPPGPHMFAMSNITLIRYQRLTSTFVEPSISPRNYYTYERILQFDKFFIYFIWIPPFPKSCGNHVIAYLLFH